jgi:two-component system KDP operon response regulator KdpE
MSGNAPLILVIDDEPQIQRFLRVSLSAHGYLLVEAGTGRQGLAMATSQPPDLILLDLGLPDMDGLEVARVIRGWSAVPIIVLSARGLEKDKVAALDLGADDYVTKPFGMQELLARVRVALRHSVRVKGGTDEPMFRTGLLRVDLAIRRVFVGEKEVRLTPIEYRLLTTLVRHAGKVLTHTILLR